METSSEPLSDHQQAYFFKGEKTKLDQVNYSQWEVREMLILTKKLLHMLESIY